MGFECLSDRLRRALLAAGAFIVAIPAPASAQDIPPHRIEQDTRSGGCLVELLPDSITGASPPRLFVSTPGRKASDALSLFAEVPVSHTAADAVTENQRNRFAGFRNLKASAALKHESWKLIEKTFQAGEPMFLTSDGDATGFHSARFDGLDTKGIIAIVERQCGFSSSVISAKSESQLMAEERALGLTSEQIRHIRWVLARRYAATRETAPPNTSGFDSTDRSRIAKRRSELGLGASRYLDATLSRALLSENFGAVVPNLTGKSSLRRFRDWVVFRSATNVCEVTTIAKRWSGYNFYASPQMTFRLDAFVSGNAMRIYLVTPNPFRNNAAVTAQVGRRNFTLYSRESQVIPRAVGGGLSNEPLKALRSGNYMEINGPSAKDGKNVSLRFSALGFSAAFDHAIRQCGRAQLNDWFR
ncbi:hypothetical protein KUV47_09095 [Vannielia litorea]|uniref:hypothetical protein n=1 Tax=Vannielia litorea TaxID=1217970 RepID=UPI001C955775|nr:hypothetical protein [Vannielia litorea]MBY6153367.1 hypothetical protein [Vannielia litorea]